MRSEWASIGGKSVHATGKAGGYVSKEWREQNPEAALLNSSNGGKIGGKIVGKMFWWNNGIRNTKSFDCPGEGWVRGMLMSEKKRNSLFGRNNNKKDK